jgi:hypothetical protein
MLTRYNKKMVTVITDDGQHWNMSPNLLHKAESSKNAESGKASVLPLKPK